ncbi:MAG: hypothetical protein QME66_13065 [Candidatus Eisenbacteria bacterium]|nr:hypothetical protein [Candidatus Eisenbacteria bacterium]
MSDEHSISFHASKETVAPPLINRKDVSVCFAASTAVPFSTLMAKGDERMRLEIMSAGHLASLVWGKTTVKRFVAVRGQTPPATAAGIKSHDC